MFVLLQDVFLFQCLILLCYYGSLQKVWGITCTATEKDVDVLMAGYAFRLKILHERGLSLLKKEGMGFHFLYEFDDLIGNVTSQSHLSNHLTRSWE